MVRVDKRERQTERAGAVRRHPATGAPDVPRASGNVWPALPLRVVEGRSLPTSGRARSPLAVAVLVAAVACLVCLGAVMVLSAGSVVSQRTYGWSYHYVAWQVPAAVGGAVVAFLLSRFDYRRLRPLSGPLLIGVLFLLLLVLVPGIGHGAYGSRRWVGPGPLKIQPSELAKLALVLWVAHVTALRLPRPGAACALRPVASGALMGPALGALVATGALVMMEPDLGTTIVLGMIVFAMLLAAGVSRRSLAALAGVGFVGVLVLSMAAPYRKARLFSFRDPWSDATASGYQVVQSLLSLGSGGPFGLGVGAGRQKWLFLPNAHTDFIFSVIGEEMGLVGTLAVVMLFGAIAWAGLRIAARAPDAFGALVAAGITAWLVIQGLLNMSTVTGLLPVTGIPLPFVSYGLSQLITSLLAVGVLASIGKAGRT